jgi:hypothetical protein
VLGAAEMLSPLTSTQQPFRFVSLPVDDRRRLGAAIQSTLHQHSLIKDAAEQKWMQKLRAASSGENRPRRRLLKFAFTTLAIGTLGVGCAFYFIRYMH